MSRFFSAFLMAGTVWSALLFADFDFSKPESIQLWLGTTKTPATVYDSTIYENGYAIGLDQLFAKGKWKLERIVNYSFQQAFVSPNQEVQIAQNPTKKKLLVTNAYMYVSRVSNPADRTIAGLSGGTFVSMYYDQWTPKSAAIAKEFLADAKKEVTDFSVYQRGVLELKETGNVGFLAGIEDYHYDWNALILDAKLKADLRNNLEGFLAKYKYDEWKKLGLPMSRGLLLYGPPGTGKTLIGKILVSQILKKNYANPVTYIHASARHLTYVEAVQAIYRIARAMSPAVVFIEDIDLIAGRGRSERQEILNELLQQLSGIEELNGVVTIGTSNFGEDIDAALKRTKRLGYHYEIGLPAYAERLELFKLFTKKLPSADLKLQDYATMSDRMTGADIKELVYAGVERAIRDKAKPDSPFLLTDAYMQYAFTFKKKTFLPKERVSQ